jgi:cytochrome P450
LTPRSPDFARVVSLYGEMGQYAAIGRWSGSRRARRIRAAAEELVEILDREAQAVGAGLAAGDVRPSSFLAELLRSDCEVLADPAVAFNLVFLLRTSSSDLTGLLHWILKLLADNPDWVAQVRRDGTAGDLPERVVLETLRLEQSEFLYRVVRSEIAIDEYVVPAGWVLRVCVGESHRDPAVFERPEVFDPDRHRGRRRSRPEFAPFGIAQVSCLGVSTTLALGSLFVGELCRGFDVRVVHDGAPVFDGFHWRPSRRFQVSLSPA